MFKKLFLFIPLLLLISGCMMMGGKTMHPTVHTKTMMIGNITKGEQINVEQVINQMIEESVQDLSSQNLDIKSIAIWGIKTETEDLNIEMFKQKLITQLVNLESYKIVNRERLSELLSEQGLSLTGTIDETSATEIGNLIGVEAFIDGYISIDNDLIMLSLNLIETKSGIFVWSKTIERKI